MLKTNAQGRKLYTLLKLSTQEVLKRNVTYPAVVDDAPLEGFDPDLKYLAIDEDLPPDYDPRLFSLSRNEAIAGDTWRVTFQALPKSKSERKAAVTNRKATELQAHVDPQELAELNLLAIDVLFTKTKGLNLTTKQQAIADRIAQIGAILWKNMERDAALQAEIEAGGDPDIDEGWQPKP